MITTFNLVSDCCHAEIETRKGVEYPLGGSTWGIRYKYEACIKCGEACDKVEACEVCGEVGCRGECE
jgi:hypothetical protein